MNTAVDDTVYYVSLHTRMPDDRLVTQETGEVTFGGYSRQPCTRTLNARAYWPECTGGGQAIRYFGVGLEKTGPGVLLFTGALVVPVSVFETVTLHLDAFLPAFFLPDFKGKLSG